MKLHGVFAYAVAGDSRELICKHLVVGLGNRGTEMLQNLGDCHDFTQVRSFADLTPAQLIDLLDTTLGTIKVWEPRRATNPVQDQISDPLDPDWWSAFLYITGDMTAELGNPAGLEFVKMAHDQAFLTIAFALGSTGKDVPGAADCCEKAAALRERVDTLNVFQASSCNDSHKGLVLPAFASQVAADVSRIIQMLYWLKERACFGPADGQDIKTALGQGGLFSFGCSDFQTEDELPLAFDDALAKAGMTRQELQFGKRLIVLLDCNEDLASTNLYSNMGRIMRESVSDDYECILTFCIDASHGRKCTINVIVSGEPRGRS